MLYFIRKYPLSLLVIAAILYALIIARLVYSVVQNQQKNTIIALVAFAIAVFITVYMILKIKKSKMRIVEFLQNLNVYLLGENISDENKNTLKKQFSKLSAVYIQLSNLKA